MLIRLLFSFIFLTAILWGLLELGKRVTWSPTVFKYIGVVIGCASVASIILLLIVELF